MKVKLMYKRIIITTILIVFFSAVLFGQHKSLKLKNIRLNKDYLETVKSRLQAGDKRLKPALDSLLKEADFALTQGAFSVMDKEAIPPSGDKHDYTSMGPYWWPDTTKSDGLPYIRRDGVVNPERNAFDKVRGSSVMDYSYKLSLAYFFTEKEKYAEHATTLIRTWFIDDATAMNPNLNFAQFIPGRSEGRGVGIIESRHICKVLEGLTFIQHSRDWQSEDTRAMKAWTKEFLNWLQTSPQGKDEYERGNNHGSWYDYQVAYFALFTDQPEIAKKILATLPQRRMEVQFDKKGAQPDELERTRSYFYSTFNLEALYAAATLAEDLGIDLWHYPNKKNPTLKKGIDYLAAYVGREEEWQYRMIRSWDNAYGNLYELLMQADLIYPAENYDAVLEQIPLPGKNKKLINLLYLRKE